MPRRTKEDPLTTKTKAGDILSSKEELFCNVYVNTHNGTQAAIEAYDIDKTKSGWYSVAKSIAYENLTKPHILRRVRELLDKFILNDETVDNELAFLVNQNADLHAKKGALDIYNKLKNRYEKHQEAGKAEIKLVSYADPNDAKK